jgi:hypothetical protein
MRSLRSQRLVALAVAGWLLLNFPLLRVAEGPWLVAVLFLLWAGLIAALAVLLEAGGDDDADEPGAGER